LIGYLSSGLMPTVDGVPIPLDAHSICVHGDSPGALAMAVHVRRELQKAGIEVAPFLQPTQENR